MDPFNSLSFKKEKDIEFKRYFSNNSYRQFWFYERKAYISGSNLCRYTLKNFGEVYGKSRNFRFYNKTLERWNV